MPKDSRDLVEVLKFELNFLEKGGYGQSPRAPWRAPLIFEDSPTCMNYDTPEERQPCSECVLTQMAPEDCRKAKIPCRHIPLNQLGETVDSCYRFGTQRELEEAVANWLRETIHGLEEERSRRESALELQSDFALLA